MNSRSIYAILLLFVSCAAFADDPEPPITWGEVPKQDLEMKSFPADSGASAVVLCDYGTMEFNQQLELVFTRHTRIKILTQPGYALATHRIPYYADDHTQRVKDLEGMTYSLDGSGNIVEKEMSDDVVFDEEDQNGWRNIKFTLPALSVGCIVEFRYTIISHNAFYTPSWNFQTTEPTRWSELRFKCPGVYGYGVVYQGYQPFFINQQEQTKESFRIRSEISVQPMTNSRWVVKDAPAVREEPYMTTTDDYVVRINFQLNEIAWPGYPVERFLNTWGKLTEALMKSGRFGGQLEGYGAVKPKAQSLVAGIQDSTKRMQAVFDFVRTSIEWNGHYSYNVRRDLDEVLEKKEGSSAEVNLLLTLMLRDAGLEAYPVVLSTRTNGRSQKLYPMIDQFDYVVAQARIGGKDLLLDATDRYCPTTLLPARALNHLGWKLVSQQKYDWVTIVPPGTQNTSTTAKVILQSDGSLTGEVENIFSGYAALYERRALSGKKASDFMKELFATETSGLTVDSFAIEAADSVELPLRVRAKISAAAYAQPLNEFLYVNPMVAVRFSESPLKLETRLYPVDIPYGSESSTLVTLTLPEGYAVEETPKDDFFTLPGNGGSYARTFTRSGNSIQIKRTYKLNQLMFEQREYATLKNFFDRQISAEAGQLVLRKQVQHQKGADPKKPEKPRNKS